MAELTVNGRPYSVCRDLGAARGGRSWLVTDGEELYVLKEMDPDRPERLAAERRVYERLASLDVPMPRLLETDETRRRLLKEYLPGPTAAELAEGGAMRAEYVDQAEELCRRLAEVGVSIDFFPESFVLSRGRLYYTEYEWTLFTPERSFPRAWAAYWTVSPLP